MFNLFRHWREMRDMREGLVRAKWRLALAQLDSERQNLRTLQAMERANDAQAKCWGVAEQRDRAQMKLYEEQASRAAVDNAWIPADTKAVRRAIEGQHYEAKRKIWDHHLACIKLACEPFRIASIVEITQPDARMSVAALDVRALLKAVDLDQK